jgi:acyl phosphate:glycerol-3-phosphate acyltransferase
VIRDLAAVVAGYLVGSIPTGLWVGRLVGGVDVRTVGSRRTGATNVQRSLGTAAGLAVLGLDFGKGFLPVVAVRMITGDDYVAAVAGLAAVVGHDWPLFAGFRGGRGVATAAGALVPLAPLALILTFACFVVTVALTRYVSLGSIVAGSVVAVIMCLLRGHATTQVDAGLIVALVGGALIIVKHADNLHRLLHGCESKLGQRAA